MHPHTESSRVSWKMASRSDLLTLVGFVCGLLFMYVLLLDRIRPLEAPRDRKVVQNDVIQVDLLTPGRDLVYNSSRCSNNSSGQCVILGVTNSTLRSSPSLQSSSWEEVQVKRRETLADTCQSLGNHGNLSASSMWNRLRYDNNIYIDDLHQVVLCTIPKVACSSWKSALVQLTPQFSRSKMSTKLKGIHLPGFMRKMGLNSPGDLSEVSLLSVIEQYTNVMMVRHPFERLLSAYRDKFTTYNKWTKHFQDQYGRKIVLLYRRNDVTKEGLLHGNDVTFEEFVRFIVDDSVPYEERINPHWERYSHLCHPCIIPYKHIIKYETMHEDIQFIMNTYFNVKNSTEFFPRRNVKKVPSADIMVTYFSTLPQELIHSIHEFYRKDMELFGYEFPEILL